MTACRFLHAAAAAVTLALVGCGHEPFESAEVTGTITYAGKPAVGVWVQFAPPEGHLQGLPSAIGVTDADGRYRLVRPGNKPGAVVGTNAISLSIMEAEGGPVTAVPGAALHKAAQDVEVKPGVNVHDIRL